MELSNKIALRPRFSLELDQDPELLLSAFENAGRAKEGFVTSRVDDHVFIRFPKSKQTFWSPQLHLEISKMEAQPTVLKGLYGPNPTMWTLFMFLHFFVATLFISAGIWLYTNTRLGAATTLPLVALILLFILWFVLYFVGRLGRKFGKDEMLLLQDFMYKILNATINPN
ncbi:GTP-binding protein [Subsaximicrobium wynnwilliamsii]|uniref:GTP-binding protein n=1 Tax=Subsaximicrobium wynnwilliamsii TaxID=291179 RepID=A0A5C6ZNF5_9FLAO|nr:GTP-binding protein [Subsaximicrobium wynnwilliamsii]TXD81646.1 GTP-binding protein [Subsaximicrobium wynnwilliamsii]TXD91027.1 GTP-binding protein [Subsaximicrobium wynnwilliamsii]TXE01094.1 GTP-binding protein [Subsaximicrobium wynnwilliamsii]